MALTKGKIAALVLGAGLGLVLALLLGGWLWARSPSAQAWLKQQLIQQVGEATGARLELDSLELRLISRLRLQGLRLMRGAQELAGVDRLELSFNPMALLGGRLSIGALRLTRPRLVWPLELPASQGESASVPPLALSIKRIQIEEGRLTPAQKDSPWQGLEGLNLAGRLDWDQMGLRCGLEVLGGRARLTGLEPPLGFKGQVELRWGHLRVQRLELDLAGNRLEATGQVELAKTPLLVDLNLKGLVSHWAPLAPWWPAPQPPQAPLNLELKIKGPLADLEVGGRFSLAQARLELEAKLDLTQPGGQGSLGFAGLSGPAWGWPGLPGALTGKARFQLAAESQKPGVRAQIDLSLEPGQLAGLDWQEAQVEAAWQSGRLSISRLSLAAPWGQVRGQGQVEGLEQNQPRLKAAASFSQLTLPASLSGRVSPLLAQARLQGRVELEGEMASPELVLDLKDSRLPGGLMVGELTGKGAWRKEALHLTSLNARGEWGGLQASGRLDQEGAQLDFSLDRVDLARLRPLAPSLGLEPPSDLAGLLSAQGRLQGPWSGPALAARGQLSQGAGAGLRAKELDLEAHLSRLDQRPLGQLSLSARDLTALDRLWPQVSIQASSQGQGAHLDLRAQGSEGRRVHISLSQKGPWGPALDLRLSALSLKGGPEGAWELERAPVNLRLGQGRVELGGLSLVSGSQKISLAGALTPQGEMSAQVAGEGLRLDRWLDLPRGPQGGRLLLDLKAGLQGSLDQPRLRLEGRVRDQGQAAASWGQVDFAGSYGPGGLSLSGQARVLGQSGLRLTVRQKMELSLSPFKASFDPQGLEAHLGGKHLVLGPWQRLLPGLSALEGFADLDLKATGSLQKPRLSGRLEIRRAALVLEASGQRFGDIKLAARLEGRRVTLETAEVTSEGKLAASGWIDLPLGGPGAADLGLDGKGFAFSLGPLGEAAADVGFTCRGPLEALAIGGSIIPRKVMAEANLTPDPSLDEVVIVRPGRQPPPLGASARTRQIQPKGLLAGATLAVRMDFSHGVRVQMPQGWVMLRGEVNIRKKPQGPLTFHDALRAEGGVIILEGKRIQIKEGRIDFGGKNVPDPDLDGKAQVTVGKTLVFLQVSGTASSPDLMFTSDPPMSQSDILSTLFFGKPGKALTGGESQDLSAQALALVAQASAQRLSRIIGSDFSPDVVTFHEELKGESSLEAGKYLSTRLYLRYRRNLAHSDRQNLGLEYRLNDYLSLEGQVGTAGESGADVIFTHDFKLSPLFGGPRK